MCFYRKEKIRCIHCSVKIVREVRRTDLDCTASGICTEKIFLSKLTRYRCCGCIHRKGAAATSSFCNVDEDKNEEQAQTPEDEEQAQAPNETQH
jgi:hypothetical protein